MPDNVLFIVADDLNSWIGALGRNPDAKTPNIDRLASRGTLFAQAYCAAPYCNASRMSVFTGRNPATTGVYENEPLWDAPTRPTTFVERLRESGYLTYGAGKVFHGSFDYAQAGAERLGEASWRDTENRAFLWDEFETNVHDPLPPSRPLNRLFDFDNFDAVPSMYHHFDWGPIPADREQELPDEAVAAAVTRFLSRTAPLPFFCAAGLYKPHLPWHVPQRFFDLYDPDHLNLPLVKNDDLDDVPPIGREWAFSPKDHELVTANSQWRAAVHGYLASVSYCDDVVGRILSALDSSKYGDNTWIILWGDNGFHLGEKLHWRKFALWEEATRVPLIIVPPKRLPRPTSHVHDPVSLIDIYPTLVDIAGLPAEPGIEGMSLIPSMDIRAEVGRRPAFGKRRASPTALRIAGWRIEREPGGEADPRAVLTTWGKNNHSIRISDWRLTRYADETLELYDHRTDPYEWTNLATDDRYREVIASLLPKLPQML